MKERPIHFTPANAQKVHLGLKTQTRRIIEGLEDISDDPSAICLQPHGDHWLVWHEEYPHEGSVIIHCPCPYGHPGDRLWVRETFRAFPDGDTYYKGEFGDVIPVHADDDPNKWKWQPSIHMPRKACRTVVELTAVRPERLQEISEDDALAEGITGPHDVGYPAYRIPGDSKPRFSSAVAAYEALWESINGHGSWALNPWVWVLTFRRVS